MSKRFVRRVISKELYYNAYKALTRMEAILISDEQFAECQRPEFEDDWVRPITESEYDLRFTRVGGDVVCFTCGQLYYDHPNEQRLYPEGYDKQLCNGWIGHT